MKPADDLHGLLAELSEADLVQAIRQLRALGYVHLEVFTPRPIHALTRELGYGHSRLPFLVFLGGVCGAFIGFGMQYYASVIAYPLDIGGRPLNSWPAFIPITFELTILFAAVTAVLGMLVLNGLPQPYHPVFHIDRFSQASQDAFFLCVEARDPLFSEATHAHLREAGAIEVWEVPR